MSLDMTIVDYTIPQRAIILSSPDPQIDRDWLNYFSQEDAKFTVLDHIDVLPSTKNTPEKHTKRAYLSGLDYFLKWTIQNTDNAVPTESLMKQFLSHLSTKPNHRTKSSGLAATTIASKYLAPIRLYLKALAGQHIISDIYNTHTITNYREQIRAAASIKNPAPDVKSNLSALMRHGTRLTKRQVNKLLGIDSIDRQTLHGKRDYALLVTAFNTGLRLAELQRITLASITEHEDDLYIVTVRGKRNNHDPVTIADIAVDAINDYVEAYNTGLTDDDPRRITDHTPLWQSLTRSGNYLPLDHRTGTNRRTKQPTFYSPCVGMSISGISGLIKNRAKIAPHDIRRTFAYLAFKAKMPIADISRQMRHSSIAVTEVYIGGEPDYHASNLATYLTLG